jgi:hypothetical protein
LLKRRIHDFVDSADPITIGPIIPISSLTSSAARGQELFVRLFVARTDGKLDGMLVQRIVLPVALAIESNSQTERTILHNFSAASGLIDDLSALS